MAERRVSLKLLDGGGDIDPVAYRALTQRLFDLSASEYKALEKRKPAFKWVTNAGAQKVVEQIQDTFGNISNVEIKTETHRIKCNIDKEAEDDDDDNNMRRRSNVSLPRLQPKNDADIDYLVEYVKLIRRMTDPEAAKFLFGMLLITKCR